MPKRIELHKTLVEAFENNYVFSHVYGGGFGGGMFDMNLGGYAGQTDHYRANYRGDNKNEVVSRYELPALANIGEMLRNIDFNDLPAYLAQEIIAAYGATTYSSVYFEQTTTRSSGQKTTKLEVIYRPLAEALMDLHDDRFMVFLNAQEEPRKRVIIQALSAHEGFWNESKISQIKLAVNRLKKYGQSVSNNEYDIKGKNIVDHAEVLLAKLNNPDIRFNGNLQSLFIMAVQREKVSFGKHRHVYRDIALHIFAIISTGVVGYALALTVSRLFTGKWSTPLQTGSERKLNTILRTTGVRP